MRLLVIGYGSIGARHSRVAAEMGLNVACVTRNLECPYPIFSDLKEAVDQFDPQFAVIANPTANHLDALLSLRELGFQGKILIEKPIFEKELPTIPRHDPLIFVAYNLRFHPLVASLRSVVNDENLLTATFIAGQYLPDWRPSVDYRSSYSAHKNLGGGVLRDLSHEIDLALWLCGDPIRLTALGGHFSQLEINSDDVYTILSCNERCQSTTISINYLERSAKRIITLNTGDKSISLDLIAGQLSVNAELVEQGIFDRDLTYRMQLEAFTGNGPNALCTLDQGLVVLKFIEQSETASAQKSWVEC